MSWTRAGCAEQCTVKLLKCCCCSGLFAVMATGTFLIWVNLTFETVSKHNKWKKAWSINTSCVLIPSDTCSELHFFVFSPFSTVNRIHPNLNWFISNRQVSNCKGLRFTTHCLVTITMQFLWIYSDMDFKSLVCGGTLLDYFYPHVQSSCA